jgi:hypothetical protein
MNIGNFRHKPLQGGINPKSPISTLKCGVNPKSKIVNPKSIDLS